MTHSKAESSHPSSMINFLRGTLRVLVCLLIFLNKFKIIRYLEKDLINLRQDY